MPATIKSFVNTLLARSYEYLRGYQVFSLKYVLIKWKKWIRNQAALESKTSKIKQISVNWKKEETYPYNIKVENVQVQISFPFNQYLNKSSLNLKLN